MRIASFLVALAALVASAGAAHAKSAVQITPDGSTILVNKQVGNEQWVLSLDLDNETLTGNVFDLTGKPPTFFACDVFSDEGFFFAEDLQGQTLTFDCQVASGCSALPCDPDVEWHALGVTPAPLPGEFFLP
jgi:hypothetical protein